MPWHYFVIYGIRHLCGLSNTAETVAPERQGTKSVNSLWATNYALCALDYIAVIQALTDFILSIHSADSKINPSVRLVSTARDNERKHISRSSSRKVVSHLQEGLATKINLPVSRAIDISQKMGDVMVLEPHQASGNKLDTFCCQRRLRSQALEKRTRREAKRQGLPISGLLARYLSESHDRRGYFCNSPAKRFARWQWLMESNLVRLPDIRIFPYKDLHQATQCFAPRNWLGEGQHGRVYHGRIAVQPSDRRQLQAVAIKRFKPTSADPMYRILAELRVHKVITKHSQSTPPSDLRQLLGVCFHISGPLLVYEFVPNGTLKQHLRRDPRSSHLLSSAMVRLSVAIDVAHALCELHYGFSLPIYYRNLKSSKILIENDFHAKLADFGDAVIVKTDSDLLTPVAIGTVGYKDPVYEKTCWAGDKTDVYSFGVILMELATHLPAWDPKRPTPLLADIVIERMRGNRGPGSDREDTDSVEQILQPGTAHGGMTLMKDLLYLAVQCCNLDLSCRPRIDEVHAALLQVQLQSIEMLLLCSGDELMIDPPPTCRTPDSPAYTTPWKP